MPPPEAISMVERDPGAVDVAVIAGGSSALYAGGSAIVEPYIQGTTSLPVTINGGSNFKETHGIARFGVRHRFAKKFSLGAGLGPSFVIVNPAYLPLDDESERRKWWAPYFDIEIAGGKDTKKKRFNVSFRPGTTVFSDRIGLAIPVGASWGRRLGRHVTLGFDSWGGVRMVFERPGQQAGLSTNPLVVPDFGVGFHIGVHIPRPKGHKMRTFMRF
jgi:hypothetical protein